MYIMYIMYIMYMDTSFQSGYIKGQFINENGAKSIQYSVCVCVYVCSG